VAEAIVAVSLVSLAAGLAFRVRLGAPYQDAPLVRDRPAITAKLEALEGKDLVIVTYSPHHNEHEEWIYNGADLEGAPIVWARDMGVEKNRRLLDHYAGRKVWRLLPDEDPSKVEPYYEGIGVITPANELR
jgi:hypothetical protein